MSGTLDMSEHRIIYLGDPVDPGDALTKRYLDSRITALMDVIVDERQKSIEPILTMLVIFDKVNEISDNKILLISYNKLVNIGSGFRIYPDIDSIDQDYFHVYSIISSDQHRTPPEKHDLSIIFLDEKRDNPYDPDDIIYLIFKRSGNYTITFNLPNDNFNIVIGHFF